VLDLLGNLVNLFDTIDQFDDFLHFANWTFLVAAFVLFLSPYVLARWNLVMLGSGLGAMAIIAWEAVEWVIQEMGTTGLQLTYDDTVGDLVLSTAGGILGAVLVATALTRGRRSDDEGIGGR
jgi:glycopeptide antibiotics resistance protein